MGLRAASQILKWDKRLLQKSKILLENVNNKSLSAVQSESMGRKSCRVNMTFLLSFEEETHEARASPLSGHYPFNSLTVFRLQYTQNALAAIYGWILKEFPILEESFKNFFQLLYTITKFQLFIKENSTVNAICTVYSWCICHYDP